MALDSEWGGGKTTFLRMWAKYLRTEGYPVAEFNAWETDFSGEPFVALSSRLEEQFSEDSAEGASEAAQRFAEAAKRVVLRATPVLVRILSQGLLDSGSLEQALTEQAVSHAQDRFDEFREGQKSIHDFTITLQEEASRLSDLRDGRPLFIMIDELDRCRPSYAVELLEISKHLFSVDRVVFVLAINRTQLAHSVKALYGAGFDASGYLRRFFDLEYTLPSPDREKFALQAFADTGLNSFFGEGPGPFEIVPKMVTHLLIRSNLDLRRIAQVIRRLSLVCAPLLNVSTAIATAASVLLVVRELDIELYDSFCDGKINDIEAAGNLYGHAGLSALQNMPEGHFLEAVLALIYLNLAGKSEAERGNWENSPLLSAYLSATNDAKSRMEEAYRAGKYFGLDAEKKVAVERAENVIDAVRTLQRSSTSFRLEEAKRSIELLPENGGK